MYGDGFTIILHHLTLRIVEVQRLRTILRDVNHVEAAVLQHTGETTLAGTEGHRLRGIVVGDVDGGILALLIVLVRTLVLVELE